MKRVHVRIEQLVFRVGSHSVLVGRNKEKKMRPLYNGVRGEGRREGGGWKRAIVGEKEVEKKKEQNRREFDILDGNRSYLCYSSYTYFGSHRMRP